MIDIFSPLFSTPLPPFFPVSPPLRSCLFHILDYTFPLISLFRLLFPSSLPFFIISSFTLLPSFLFSSLLPTKPHLYLSFCVSLFFLPSFFYGPAPGVSSSWVETNMEGKGEGRILSRTRILPSGTCGSEGGVLPGVARRACNTS